MPRPTRNSAWVVVPRCDRPGHGRRVLDRGHVDVGGQVLAPDVEVRVVVDSMAQVGAQRPVAPPDWVVQGLGRVAVVDEQHDPSSEARRYVGDPAVERKADLGALAVREAHALGGETAGQGGRRRVGLDVDEGAVTRADSDLAEGALADDDPVCR